MSMKLIDSPAFYQACRAALQQELCFGVWLFPGFLGIRKGLLCSTVLDPLIPYTENIVVYDLKPAHPKLSKLIPLLAKENSGHHILNMAGKRWSDFLPLLYKPNIWGAIHHIRGAVRIQCADRDIPWASIFRHCYGPAVTSSSKSTVPKEKGSDVEQHQIPQSVFIIIEPINSGLESLSITGPAEQITAIFDIAANTCSLTKHFLGVF